jgi:hypothetical protein
MNEVKSMLLKKSRMVTGEERHQNCGSRAEESSPVLVRNAILFMNSRSSSTWTILHLEL